MCNCHNKNSHAQLVKLFSTFHVQHIVSIYILVVLLHRYNSKIPKGVNGQCANIESLMTSNVVVYRNRFMIMLNKGIKN